MLLNTCSTRDCQVSVVQAGEEQHSDRLVVGSESEIWLSWATAVHSGRRVDHSVLQLAEVSEGVCLTPHCSKQQLHKWQHKRQKGKKQKGKKQKAKSKSKKAKRRGSDWLFFGHAEGSRKSRKERSTSHQPGQGRRTTSLHTLPQPPNAQIPPWYHPGHQLVPCDVSATSACNAKS
jgi:hypothetical protein